MSTGLNIKNAEAVQALRALAAHYDTNCTQAIVRAAQDVLSQSDDDRRRAYAVRVDTAVDAFWQRASGTPDDFLTDADLYDEHGLPK